MLEHVERLSLAAAVAQVTAVRAQDVRVLAHRSVLSEQRDRLAVGLVGALRLGRPARLGDRPPGVAALVGKLGAERQRLLAEMFRAGGVAGCGRAHRLHPADDREVVVVGPRSQQPFRLVEVVERPAVVVSGRDGRIGAGDVRPSQVNGVLGRLEQRDRAAEVVERGERLGLLEREPPERPVEPHAGVAVADLARAREHLRDHRLRALELAEVGERVAQVGAVAHPCCEVLRLDPGQLLERPLEDRHRLAR